MIRDGDVKSDYKTRDSREKRQVSYSNRNALAKKKQKRKEWHICHPAVIIQLGIESEKGQQNAFVRV